MGSWYRAVHRSGDASPSAIRTARTINRPAASGSDGQSEWLRTVPDVGSGAW
jgi:hypothetical protein